MNFFLKPDFILIKILYFQKYPNIKQSKTIKIIDRNIKRNKHVKNKLNKQIINTLYDYK